MSGKVKSLVFVRVVGLLENGHIVSTALVQVCVFVRVHRINLKTYNLEIFAGNFAGLSNVFDV